jgi:hypothetical protein
MMAFNSDAYIADLVKKGFSKSEAVNSARYEAQAQAYVAANPVSKAAQTYVGTPFGSEGTAGTTATAKAAEAAAAVAATDKATADKTAAEIAAKAAAKAAADKAAADAAAKAAGVSTATQELLLAQQKAAADAAALRDRQSAYDILYNEFNKYGLGSLVEDVKGLIQSNVSPSQFSLELQNTNAYKQRFTANQDRIKAGLKALTPAEYIGLEDQYQNIMRTYGMPSIYYTKDGTGKQAGFEKFLANDVSASELEDRIATAQQRVLNSNPEVLQALKQFYPDINNADILAYTLDPQNALTGIKRKVTAAEIGGAALAQGLQAQGGTAESLAGLGITKAQAQQGYTDIAGILPRASQLSDIYGQGQYTQGTAEAEVFNTAGAAAATAKRKKLTSLETAAFSGSSGVGALGRDKGIYGSTQGQTGQY